MKPKEKVTGKLSEKQKLWIGIGVVVLLLAVCTVAGWFCYQRAWGNNPRFYLKYVSITPPPGYTSSYWNSELHREERCRKLMDELELEKDKPITRMDLEQIHDKVLKMYPEIESVEVSRVLPDTLNFVIRERVPVANIGPGSGKVIAQIWGKKQNRYLDSNGVVLSEEHCQNAVLPMIIDFTDKGIANLKPGDKADSSAIQLALGFIDLINTNAAYQDIVIRTILLVQHQKSIQCNVRYKGEKEYVVIMPYPISREKLSGDVMGRLIAALDTLQRRPEEKYTINLQFENQAVIRVQK